MRIFISFASIDRDLAEEVGARLRGDGHHVFVDQHSLEPGVPYDAVIRKEVTGCDLFVFFVSPESVAQGYARTELDVFADRAPNPGRRLLVFEVRPTAEALLPPYLRGIHIARRSGNLVADIVSNVEKRARARRRRWITAVGTMLAVGVAGGVAALRVWPHHVNTVVADTSVTHAPADAAAFRSVALDPALAGRVRAVTVADGGLWLVAADPNALIHLDDEARVVESVSLDGAPTAIAATGGQVVIALRAESSAKLVSWDIVGKKVAWTIPIALPRTRDTVFAQVPYAIGIAGSEIWVATSGDGAAPAVASLGHEGKWRLRMLDIPNDIEHVTFSTSGGMLFMLTSGSPGYIYRLARDGVWQVSGHEVEWVGCLDAMTTSGEPWLGVSCDREIVNIQSGTWPPLKVGEPTEASTALTSTILVHGLGKDYSATGWRADFLAHADHTVVAAMEHLDRSQVPYQFLDSAVVATNETGTWTEVARVPDHVTSLAVYAGMIVFVTEHGARAFRFVDH